MTTVTIKGLPSDVHRAFKARAKSRGRSLNREIIGTLEAAVRAVAVDAEDILRQAHQVREASTAYLTQREIDASRKAGRS